MGEPEAKARLGESLVREGRGWQFTFRHGSGGYHVNCPDPALEAEVHEDGTFLDGGERNRIIVDCPRGMSAAGRSDDIITSFSYNSGGYLQTIEDPAGRLTTFTHSGANLTGVTLPDASTWGYSYASGGQLTQITDPRSNPATIVYDSAGRVATITQRDGTTEEFSNDQESGWTNSGTSLSPAAATLLAQSGSTFTSPNGNATTIQPDWMGLGMAGNIIDALGDDQLYDLNSNGLATVAVDQVNRNTQFSYDSKGNITS